MDKNHFRYLPQGGIFEPFTFALALLICAAPYPEYSHLHQLISELGATGKSNSNLINFAGFIFSGVMITAFGLSLMLLLPRRPAILIGSAFIMLIGIGMTMAGVFSCDEGCPPHGSLENKMHFQIYGQSFLLAYTGILLLFIDFRKLPLWKGLWVYSLISSLLSLAFNLALANSLGSDSFTGLWQRLMLLIIFLWCGIVGIRMFRLGERQTALKKIIGIYSLIPTSN